MVTRELDTRQIKRNEEYLTPGAAARLFGISEAAVRAARLRGYVASPVIMGITGKAVHLLDMRSAFDYWEASHPPDTNELNRMRRNGVSLNLEDGLMHVLHSHPVLDFSSEAQP